jgi:hypothetical protein
VSDGNDIVLVIIEGESEMGKPYGALLLDVGGTLLETSQPVPDVYAAFGAKYGGLFVGHIIAHGSNGLAFLCGNWAIFFSPCNSKLLCYVRSRIPVFFPHQIYHYLS